MTQSNATRLRNRAIRLLKKAQYKRDRVRYKIIVQGRLGYCRPGWNLQDWRSWRQYASPGILFHSEEEAHAYASIHDPTKGLSWRKMSWSIEKVIIGDRK